MRTNFIEKCNLPMMWRITSRWSLAALFAIGLAPMCSAQAAGTVGSGTPESCTEAALDAALAGGGMVKFDCGPTPHTITVAATKTLAADTTVDGSNIVTLSGGDSVRIFWVNPGVNVTLRNLTVAQGYDAEKFAEPGLGGGLFNDGGHVTIIHCLFSGNRTYWGGGAIWSGNNGTLIVRNSSFIDNAIQWRWSGDISVLEFAGGGAIRSLGSALTISGSLFNANVGDFGIINNQNGSTAIDNSTFTGNSGGIYSVGAVITNSTITGDSTYGVIGTESGPSVTLRNTIIAHNAKGNCIALVIDGGHNLQYPGTSCGATIPVADPLLGPLASNGGVTQTLAPLPGSPAIDAGDSATCPATDQRGWPRVNGDGFGGAVCDIGAHEFTPAVPPARNVTGLWWNPDAAGMSLSLHQNVAGITFGVWYTYGIDHQDMWLTLQGDWVSPGTFAGTLRRTTGPAIGDPSDPTQVSLFPVGSGVLSFTDAGHGTFSYALGGVAESKPIRRFEF